MIPIEDEHFRLRNAIINCFDDFYISYYFSSASQPQCLTRGSILATTILVEIQKNKQDCGELMKPNRGFSIIQ